jgi:hypothetical protein
VVFIGIKLGVRKQFLMRKEKCRRNEVRLERLIFVRRYSGRVDVLIRGELNMVGPGKKRKKMKAGTFHYLVHNSYSAMNIVG